MLHMEDSVIAFGTFARVLIYKQRHVFLKNYTIYTSKDHTTWTLKENKETSPVLNGEAENEYIIHS